MQIVTANCEFNIIVHFLIYPKMVFCIMRTNWHLSANLWHLLTIMPQARIVYGLIADEEGTTELAINQTRRERVA